MSDDDRYATKAAVAGPLAPGFLSPGAKTATSNTRPDEITAALIFCWKAATAAPRPTRLSRSNPLQTGCPQIMWKNSQTVLTDENEWMNVSGTA
ncbi:hypothetical protein LJR022_009833 [Paraburkholderia hospita]|uniref:hypothetical protein n=1 Tax=Paraburkholderia hospita TaxID=169430 RepID=UPI003ED147F8